MYDLKYKHKIPLVATKARNHGTIPKVRVLLMETHNTCPICKKIIQSSNRPDDSKYIGNIAHIYARKNFYDKRKLLPKDMFPNYYHIKSESELDESHNLILLCKKCHDEYDELPRINYESYKSLLDKKKELWNNLSEEEKLYNAVIYLNENINEFESKTRTGLFNTIKDTGFKKKKIIQKFKLNGMKTGKINSVYEKEVINTTISSLKKYYILLDDNEELSQTTIKKIGKIYQNLKKTNSDKEKILKIMYGVMTKKNVYEYEEKIQAIISYCIMKCEVLDNE